MPCAHERLSQASGVLAHPRAASEFRNETRSACSTTQACPVQRDGSMPGLRRPRGPGHCPAAPAKPQRLAPDAEHARKLLLGVRRLEGAHDVLDIVLDG